MEGSPIHPGIPTLFRYGLGELPAPRQKEVAAHLSKCSACGLELRRLDIAPDAVGNPGTPDLAGLLTRVRGWEAGASRVGRTGEALKQRVAGEIEPYLGKRATHSILQPVVEDGRNLLSSVSPILTMFLGRRATEHLVSHVVEHAIVRT